MMNESECRAHASNFGEAPETMPIAFDTRYRIDPSQHHRKQSGTLSVGDCSPCKSAPTMTAYDIGSPSHRLPNGFQRIIPSRFQRNYSTMPDGVRQIEYDRRIYAPISSDANKDVNDMMVTLDYTTASTSTSSGASSGIEYKRRHRCTLPSITTTITDTTTSDYSNADSLDNHQNAINYGLLHVQKLDEDDIDDETAKNNKNRTQERENRLKNEISEVLNDNNGEKQLSKTRQSTNAGRSGVRRVASFTFSSEGSKHNHRHLPTSGPLTRKFTLGPLGKTFSYLKNKMDIANSSPSLYDITNEDCHHWQESFEALLNNKYGCALFRQFLNQEFSVENLDFWLNCKEFKRMKSGKKATAQKAQHIFNLYVKDGAEKEVNLDSATKAATKAAMESGIHANTFDLAQTKIEQLMAKDSYPRFLKSDLYLAALNGDQPQHFGAASIKRTESARDVTPMTGTTARRHTCVPDQSESLAVHEIVDRLRSGQLAAKVTSGTTNPTSASADGLKSV